MKQLEADPNSLALESLKPTLDLAQNAFNDYLASNSITSMLVNRHLHPEPNPIAEREVLAARLSTNNEEKVILQDNGYTAEESNLASVLILQRLVSDPSHQQALEVHAAKLNSNLYPSGGIARAKEVIARLFAKNNSTRFDRQFSLANRATEFTMIMQSLPADITPILASAGVILNDHKQDPDIQDLEKTYATATKTIKEMDALRKSLKTANQPKQLESTLHPQANLKMLTEE